MPVLSQSNFLQTLGWAVINSLWQMAALWLIYHIYIFIFKPGSAAKTKSAFIILCLGLVWFVSGFFFSQPAAYSIPQFMSVNATPLVLKDSLIEWLPAASVVYLFFLTVQLTRFFLNIRQVIIIRKTRLKKIEVQWRLFVKKMAACFEIRRPVQVWISENITTPVTIGFLKPVILVPMAAVNHLTPLQMEAVLLHELVHIKRNDYLVNMITTIIKTLFYFNPFTRSLAAAIETEREKNCDEWVLQYQYDAYSYSSALLILEKMRLSGLQLALAASSGKELLLERVKKIMGVKHAPVFSLHKTMSRIFGIAIAICIFISLFTHTVTDKLSVPQNKSSFALQNIPGNSGLQFASSWNDKTAFARKKTSEKPGNTNLNQLNHLEEPNDGIIPAGFIEQVTPLLSEAEEEQVTKTLEASKKIIKNMQWKEVEKSAADALNASEKNVLQALVERKMEKSDWDKMADKLRLSYDQINWDNMNAKIAEALHTIKVDSVVKVYGEALVKLSETRNELIAEGQKGIPDSKLTLKEIEIAKSELENSLKKIQAAKSKRIIRL